MNLYFVPSKFPRTISRAEWREIWRWKRVVEKRLAEEMQKQSAALGAFGSVMLPQARSEMIDNMEAIIDRNILLKFGDYVNDDAEAA